MRRTCIQLAMVGLLSSVALAQPGVPAPELDYEDARQVADGIFRRIARESPEKVPGLSATVAVRGRVVYSNAYGYADLEAKAPATPETRFRIYSSSKSIGAITAMILSESGELDLDAPISTYLPDLPPHIRPITSRQILAHHSGIRHYREGEWVEVSDFNCAGPLQALPDFVDDPLLFEPGTGFGYSTFAYALLAAVVEAATRTPFDQLVRERVFEPAGMTATAIEGRPVDGYETARFYAEDEASGEFEETVGIDASCKFFGGGFVSTSEDLARLGSAVLDGTLLGPESLGEMWRLHTQPGEETPAYGLGFFAGSHLTRVFGVTEEEYVEAWLHGGSGEGGYSVFILYPQQQATVAITMNARAGKYMVRAVNALAGAFLETR